MKKVYLLLLSVLILCIGCQWRFNSQQNNEDSYAPVERYDRIQALYLATGDRSALQQLNTKYPEQTRILIEDVLNIGAVNEPLINKKFLQFYQDSMLQVIIADVQKQYADINDIDNDLNKAFKELQKLLPNISHPVVYTQIGALTQSIIVRDTTLGISLDKYLGADYPIYKTFYPTEQRKLMTRSMIVPDCICFYILSNYPLNENDTISYHRQLHMAKIQWIANKVTHKNIFNSKLVKNVNNYIQQHPKTKIDNFLADNDSIN